MGRLENKLTAAQILYPLMQATGERERAVESERLAVSS